MRGFLDRIEDDKFAVLLVDELNKEFIVDKNELPEGSAAGAYFQLTIENDKITSIQFDESTTTSEQQQVNDMMAKLRSKSKGRKFKKK